MKEPLLAIGSTLLGIFSIGGAVRDWRRGKTYDAYGAYPIGRRPITFWSLLIAWVLVGIIALAGGIIMLFT